MYPKEIEETFQMFELLPAHLEKLPIVTLLTSARVGVWVDQFTCSFTYKGAKYLHTAVKNVRDRPVAQVCHDAVILALYSIISTPCHMTHAAPRSTPSPTSVACYKS